MGEVTSCPKAGVLFEEMLFHRPLGDREGVGQPTARTAEASRRHSGRGAGRGAPGFESAGGVLGGGLLQSREACYR